MIRLYYHPSPNPAKVALFLEEAGLPYELVPVDTRRGQQHEAAFRKINPNGKTPAIEDTDGPGGKTIRVFDSNAILLYLGEKTGKFMPANTLRARGELLSWLMFVASGVGPFSGQAVHFSRFAPEPKEYAVTRYVFEAKRHYGIADARLAQHKFMLGDSYTIVDMALWGWARLVPFVLGDDALGRLPNLKRLLDTIDARPAAARALALKDRHSFKAEFDDEAKRYMFRHTVQPA